jgi:hypothetical protein
VLAISVEDIHNVDVALHRVFEKIQQSSSFARLTSYISPSAPIGGATSAVLSVDPASSTTRLSAYRNARKTRLPMATSLLYTACPR